MSEPLVFSEPVASHRSGAEAAAEAIRETAESTRHAAQRLRCSLDHRIRRINHRVTETAAQWPVLQAELREDAVRAAQRARSYLDARPIHSLGLIAGGAFLIGMAIGLGRH